MCSQGISEHADLFTEVNEEKHQRYRKVVQPAYQMSNVLKSEGAIDGCTNLLLSQLQDLADNKVDIDLGRWLHLYAHDVLGSVLFGRRFGFLETGDDVDSFIESVSSAVPLLHIIGQGPTYLRRTILYAAILLIPGTMKSFKAVAFMSEKAKKQTQLRIQDLQDGVETRPDILSQLLLRTVPEKDTDAGEGENEGEAWFTHKEVTLDAWAGLMAGSDSVAINMRAVLYYLMKDPDAMTQAIQELQGADNESLLSTPITFHESTRHLPYIAACIKEASRIFSSSGFNMPRVSPAEGITLSDFYIAPGYSIGVNSAVVQHDTGLFGEDAGEFRPERWLESAERSFAMEKGMIMFGAGTRTCIGKNVSAEKDITDNNVLS
jgi:cytochrome P450